MEKVPSTIRMEKDSWSAHVKLLIGVALFKVTVTKTLQSPLDVSNAKLLSVGQTLWCLAYRTTAWLLLLHGILATNRLDTIVGSHVQVDVQQFRHCLQLIPKPKVTYN